MASGGFGRLIWTYLFPADARFESIGRSTLALPQTKGTSGPRVFVGQERVLLESDTSPAFGLVVFNSSRDIAFRLASRGFQYVREFAGVPHLRDARFLMPLDGGRAASGVFDLYAPYRPLARAKLAIARGVATLGLPVWTNERICVAQRVAPSLELLLQKIFYGAWFRIGFSTGTPGGFPKPTFVVTGKASRPLAFGKIAGNPFRRQAIAHEADALSRLASRNLAPRLLFAGDADSRFVTLQKPLDGAPGARTLSEPHQHFLASLTSADWRPASSSTFVRRLQERVIAVAGRSAELAILSRLLPMLEGVVLPLTVVHGDFAPWNLRQHDAGITAFDWEWWSDDGLPLVDEIHHTLQVGFLLEDWIVERADTYLRSLAASLPLGLSERTVYLVAGLGILDYYVRILEDGYSESGNLAHLYWALLARILTRLGREIPSVGSDELLA